MSDSSLKNLNTNPTPVQKSRQIVSALSKFCQGSSLGKFVWKLEDQNQDLEDGETRPALADA